MKVDAQKRRGDPCFYLRFTPDSELDQNFLKVLSQMAVDGGQIRVAAGDERAIFDWDGIEDARIRDDL